MKPVADEKPAAFENILAAEYKALRPDAGSRVGRTGDEPQGSHCPDA